MSAGREVEAFAKTFEEKNDDYNAIIVKALGDRFAEGLAEYLHKKIRMITTGKKKIFLQMKNLSKKNTKVLDLHLATLPALITPKKIRSGTF